MQRSKLLCSTVFCIAVTVPAFGQDVEASQETAAPQRGFQIDEIIVTAQKRAENIQDVPLSVSAVSGEDIKQSNIENLNDLSAFTPNVNIAASSSVSFITIRGLGSGNNKGFEQAIGLVIDGVFYNRRSYMSDALLDVAQVEVLRGPQGTLFGKNTVAGALNITTGRPRDEWGWDLAVLGGDYNQYRVDAMLTGPLFSDSASFRVAGKLDKSDGYIENTTLDRDEAGLDKLAFNNKLSLVGNNGFEATVGLTYSKSKDNGQGYQLSLMSDRTRAAYTLFDPEVDDVVDDKNSHDADTFDDRESISTFLELKLPLGDYDLVSITGYSTFDNASLIDADFGPAPLLKQGVDDTYEQLTQEFRIASPLGTIDYVAGLYLFGSRLDGFTDLDLLPGFDAAATAQGLLVPDALNALLGPVLDALPPLVTPTDEGSQRTFNQETVNAALFGQANWNILDRLTLTAGLRGSWQRKDVFIKNVLDGTGLVLTAVANQENYETARQRTELALSPKISGKFQFTEDVMMYATIARGFKGGGYNEQAGSPDEVEFEEEESTTYEIGLKSEFMGGLLRANIAGFYTNFSNLQVSVYNGINFNVGNAAEATTQGFETEFRLILPPWMMVMAAFGYTDATYDSFPNGPCPVGEDPPCDLTGQPLARAPEYNGSLSVQGALPLGNTGVEFIGGGDLLYQSKSYLSTDLDEADAQDAFTQYNARLGFRSADGLWSFVVFGRNLTDERFNYGGADVPLQQGTHFGAFDPGRRYSAEFRVNY